MLAGLAAGTAQAQHAEGGGQRTAIAWPGTQPTGITNNQDENVRAAPTRDDALQDQVATAGTQFSYQFSPRAFIDADNDPLTYTAALYGNAPLPGWLAFDAANRTFSGTPGVGDVGTLTVQVTASDGAHSTDDEFELVVSATTLDELALADEYGNAVPFSPAFASTTPSYTTTVPYPIEHVTVEPTTTADSASIEFLDGVGIPIADADTSESGHQVALAAGPNVIDIAVTAADGVSSETYTLTVTRAAPMSSLPPRDCRADAVWCTTLVAETNPESPKFQFGYCQTGMTNCEYGNLDTAAFILDGAGYGVESVRLYEYPDDFSAVHLSLDDHLPASRLAALELRIGPHVLGLETAAEGADPLASFFTHNYEWTLPFGSNKFITYGHDRAVTVQLSVAPNIAASGAPVIESQPRVGRTIGVDANPISDANGLEDATFAYQWVRVDGATETDIAGATSTTYMPVAADVGKTLKVRVSFTDDNGYAEAVTSNATATVDPDITTDSADRSLAALALTTANGNAVTLEPYFKPGRTAYEASVANAITGVTVTPTTRDDGASIEYLDASDTTLADADGAAAGFQLALAEGENVVKLKVTAENGTSTQTYTVTVTRAVTATDYIVPCVSGARWCETLTVGELNSPPQVWILRHRDGAMRLRQPVRDLLHPEERRRIYRQEALVGRG